MKQARPHLEEAGRATRFQPGRPSPNPGGRPRGIARAFRDVVEDPSELATLLLAVANDPKERTSDRLAAVRELLDRGYGRAPTFAAIEGSDPLEQDQVSAEIAAIAAELAAGRADAA